MKDETDGVTIKELVELKGVNKNFVATRSHNEYRDVLLNKRFLRNA